MPDAFVLRKAAVLCYRIYDVAEGIDLERSRALLAQDSRRLKLRRAGSEYLVLSNPPLAVELGRRPLAVRGGPVAVEVSARLFDHGAVSIVLRVPVEPGTPLDGLVPLADELYDSAAAEALCAELLGQVRQALLPALDNPHQWENNESYSVVFVEKIDGDPKAQRLLEAADLPRLLLGECGPALLSPRERSDVLEQHFSYTEDDLAVIDWNAAFVYEPSGSGDIPDLLEICNAQLLELRYFDDVLDTQLRSVYGEVTRARGRWQTILFSPYKVLARRVLATLFDMSEFIERVENSLKIVGDVYLAKVYEAAVVQLRVPNWQASVTKKQQLLAQTYQLLKGEVDTDRALTLESAIVLLIVIEMLLALISLLR